MNQLSEPWLAVRTPKNTTIPKQTYTTTPTHLSKSAVAPNATSKMSFLLSPTKNKQFLFFLIISVEIMKLEWFFFSIFVVIKTKPWVQLKTKCNKKKIIEKLTQYKKFHSVNVGVPGNVDTPENMLGVLTIINRWENFMV